MARSLRALPIGTTRQATGEAAMSGYQRPALIVGTMYILAVGLNCLTLTRSRAPYQPPPRTAAGEI